jgi:DNA-binding response OmpR family regulator
MKARVLLAEDDVDQTDVLADFLRYEQYQVDVAHNPAATIAQLDHEPDVVLLDLNGVCSPEVMDRLEALPVPPRLVLLSADVKLEEMALKLRAHAHLYKPYDLSELLLRLDEVLADRAREQRLTATGVHL